MLKEKLERVKQIKNNLAEEQIAEMRLFFMKLDKKKQSKPKTICEFATKFDMNLRDASACWISWQIYDF